MTILKADYTHLAQMALNQYPVKAYSLSFLGHSDNLTFRVDEIGGASYLLRLHDPVTNYYRGIRQLPEAVTSELAWLEALADQGGFSVQRAVRTCEGKLLGSIETAPGNIIPVTLLTWLGGAHFSPSAPGGTDQIERFGRLVARLHDFSSSWMPEPQLVRPRYDLDHFKRIFARLLRGTDLGVFSEDIYRILRATGKAILSEISQLPNDSLHWGMIHADLHVGNFLVCDEEIVPIDFSFCGFGHYLFDLSVTLAGGLNAALRPHFLNGYRSRRSFSDSELRAVEAYALAGRVSYYAYQIDNPTERNWLKTRIPRVAEYSCQRFLQGESILYEL